MNGMNIVIRQPSSKDHPFIYSTWLRNVYYDITESLRPNQDAYFKSQSAMISKLLQDDRTRVRVAGDTVDDLWIAGYSVSLANELHFIYVRKDFRKQGLATLLLKDLPITHVRTLTKIGADISEKKGLIFQSSRR
jgi:GNAT superfamily N-acetyltransferase